MHRSPARIAAMVLGVLLIAVPTVGMRRASALTTALAPASYATVKGASGGQPVANLATVDGAVVTFGPGPYVGDRTYTVPESIDPASIWGITLRAMFRGPVRSTQHWQWQLYDWTTRRWSVLGVNADSATASGWQSLVFYAGGTLASAVDPASRHVLVRLRSFGHAGAIASMDAESLSIDAGALPSAPGWKPPIGSRWQYQLQDNVDTSLCVVPWRGGGCVRPQTYDIDLYSNDGVTPNTAAVTAVHAAGAHAICYVSAGSFENWRPDAGAFPNVVKGRSNGWPGERWLDVRRLDVLLPIMSARVKRCVSAGFDAVEFDNVDGVSNRTGFPLTGSDQVTYNRALATIAHDAHLSVGLKNDIDQLTQLLPWFDFAINEQCHQYKECGGYDAWVAAGKAVVQVEYAASMDSFCAESIAGGRSAIKKALALHATPWVPCA